MSAPSIPTSVAASRLEASVGAVLDDLRTFRIRFWAPILLGVIMMFDSWDSIAVAYVLPSMSAEWHLKPVSMGFVVSAGYCGQFIGAVVLGALAERIGRKPVFIGAVSIMSVLALCTAFAPNYSLMLVLRLTEGLMIGGALPISITYVNELAPTKTRGRYFVLFQVLCMSGYACASVASTFIIPHFGWRWLFGIGAAPVVLLPLMAATLPESPRWLARLGRMADANRALEKLGGRPVTVADGPADEAAPIAEIQKGLTFTALFKAPFLPRTIVVTLLWFLVSFATFGLTTWVPSIYVGVFHIPIASALRYASISAIGFLVFAPFVGLVIDRIGRRPIAMVGCFLGALTMLGLALYRPTSEAILVPIVITGHVGISITALLIWPYTAETYPTNVRAIGLGYASAVARGASMLTPLATGFILQAGAPVAFVFGIYGVCALGALAVWLKYTRETAQVPLDAI